MNNKWLCLLFLGVAVVSTKATFDAYPEYESSEYDNVFDDESIFGENPIIPQDQSKIEYVDTDKKVDEEIQLFRDKNEVNLDELVKDIGSLEDYQIEDNRSKDKEELQEVVDEDKSEILDENASDEDWPMDLGVDESEVFEKIDDIPEDKKQAEVANDYALLWGDPQEQAALSKIKDDDKKILDEAQAILEADNEQGINIGKKVDDEIVNPENNENIPEKPTQDEVANDYALLWGDVQEQEALSKLKDDEKKILEETQAILEADNEQGNGFEKEDDDEAQIDDKVLEETRRILQDNDNNFENNQDTNGMEKDEATHTQKLMDEFKKTLEEIDSDYNEDIINDENEANEETNNQANSDEDETNLDIQGGDNNDEEIVKTDGEDEDTADKVYADLNADLDKLIETIEKLRDDGDVSESDYKDEMFNDALNMNPLDYEEKYGKPYREGLVLSAREDYDNAPDSIFNDSDKSDDTSAEVLEPDVNNGKANDEIDETDDDSIDTSVNGEPFPDDGSLFMDAPIVQKQTPVPNLVEPPVTKQYKYANDAFVNDEINDVASEIENKSTEDVSKGEDSNSEERIDKISVDDLSSSQLNELMEQFSALHKDEFDTQSEDFDQHVAPVHITLKVNEPVIVTSPNYPSPYPTNNIIDWMFDGEGVGIELNITNFAINSALGDYLLIKPGGLDQSGNDGLVFSYHLNSERRYRFMDVDRMFVRFESKAGVASHKGFEFSVRMISPLPEEPEPIPEPEPVVNPPSETLTLNLGGVTLAQFRDIEEEFRLLIADMADQYISANDIEPGLNATVDITQITSTALCNIHWPEFENCAEITFGIPLWYEDEELEPRLNEEDLQTMWRTYVNQDPFALRLKRMGITEFLIPNDRSVLMVWLVIAVGVVICTGLVAVALWRFSCSENYTRMKSHSDTDSVQREKRGLDLYPTPHQTLPPLYSENEYKWSDAKFDDSTRVDMGGFANKSYVRDDLFEFDSEEEVITPRDSNNTTKQRDFFKNV